MTADEVCEKYSEESVELVLRILKGEDGDGDSILIEGPRRALEMLAELLKAVAEDSDDSGFQIAPFGAGSFHFSKGAEIGLYIQRVKWIIGTELLTISDIQMNQHHIFYALDEQKQMLAARIQTTNKGRLAWVGVYPLDIDMPVTKALFFRHGHNLPKNGPVYFIRCFEIDERLVNAELSEADIRNSIVNFAYSKIDLVEKLNKLGIDPESLEWPHKSDYPIWMSENSGQVSFGDVELPALQLSLGCSVA
jgi:hypothetical protein